MLKKILDDISRKKTLDDIKKAVNDFNNSPWIDLGSPYELEETLERARDKGIDVILNEIRRADIKLFHTEEAKCGNI